MVYIPSIKKKDKVLNPKAAWSTMKFRSFELYQCVSDQNGILQHAFFRNQLCKLRIEI